MSVTEAYISKKHVVAKVVDQYGDERLIYKNHGHGLRIKNDEDNSVVLKLNRVLGPAIGLKIKEKRLQCGMTLEQLAKRAGLRGEPAKAQMWAIEKGLRKQAIRIGTLYAIAAALDCEATELLPTVSEILLISDISVKTSEKLS